MTDTKPTTRETVVFVVSILLLIAAIKLLHAYLFYGDATCAFVECRKVVSDVER